MIFYLIFPGQMIESSHGTQAESLASVVSRHIPGDGNASYCTFSASYALERGQAMGLLLAYAFTSLA